MAESSQGRQPKRVVCTCRSFSCYTKTYLDIYGQSQRGHLVSTTTRSTHRARDRDDGEVIQLIGDKVGDKVCDILLFFYLLIRYIGKQCP